LQDLECLAKRGADEVYKGSETASRDILALRQMPRKPWAIPGVNLGTPFYVAL
jgi:hypothetical protein